jgi:ABC-2 type transport system permease protein
MRNLRLIAKREYLERVRTRAFLLSTLLLPVLMFAVTVLPARLMLRGGNTRHLVVVASPQMGPAIQQALATPATPDRESGRTATRFVVDLTSDTSPADRARLVARVDAKQVDAVVWATDDALAAHKVEYLAREAGDLGEQAQISSALRMALIKQQLAARGIASEEAEQWLQGIDLEARQVTNGKLGEPKNSLMALLGTLFLVLTLYTTVLMYGISVMRSILEEKNSRVLEVVMSSATARDLLGGKVVGVGAVGLTQMLVWAVMAGVLMVPGLAAVDAKALNLSLTAIVAFVAFFLLGYVLYSAMAAAVGAMVNSDQEAQQLQLVIMLPMILSIVLMNAVYAHPNSILAVVMSLVPFCTPVLMFLRVVVSQPPLWQVVLSVVLMLGTIWGTLLVSARIYRIGILMHGKRPTLAELRKWLTYA